MVVWWLCWWWFGSCGCGCRGLCCWWFDFFFFFFLPWAVLGYGCGCVGGGHMKVVAVGCGCRLLQVECVAVIIVYSEYIILL